MKEHKLSCRIPFNEVRSITILGVIPNDNSIQKLKDAGFDMTKPFNTELDFDTEEIIFYQET